MAVGGVYRERLPIAVEARFYPSHQRQFGQFGGPQDTHLENVVGTHADAVFLALAPGAVDHRSELASVVLAIRSLER